jgi:hypothetical protein
MPSLISSHISRSNRIKHLVKHATTQSLIIYVHREGTNRLRSAISQVAVRKCVEENNYLVESTPEKIETCKLKEEAVIKFIADRELEIGHSETRILTCETYESIEDNAPNFVFMNYKQANKMQTLLAKHLCPEEQPIHTNDGSKKFPIFVELENSDGGSDSTRVDLNDWLDAKMELIEIVLHLKDDVSCQAKTRKMERALLSCPDETLLFSSPDLFDSA